MSQILGESLLTIKQFKKSYTGTWTHLFYFILFFIGQINYVTKNNNWFCVGSNHTNKRQTINTEKKLETSN
jgi:hypothetical protein